MNSLLTVDRIRLDSRRAFSPDATTGLGSLVGAAGGHAKTRKRLQRETNKERRVSIQSVRKSFSVAACAAVALLGLSAVSAPAQAQVRPTVSHCFVGAQTQGVFNCSPMQMELRILWQS